MRIKHNLFIPLFCLLLILSGCVGKRELNDLAMVMAVGIDKGEEAKVRVTIQVPRPSDARGQTGAPAGNTGDPIWSAFGEGDTIFEAIRDLSSFSSRRVFWAHNYVIVINEDFAKEGIGDVIDFFTRNPELRMHTWVVTSPDKASKIITTITGLEIIPGQAIEELFQYSTISSKAPQTQMLDLQTAYLADAKEPFLARVKIIDKGASNKEPGKAKPVKQIQLAGTSVFKGDRLVGTLNEDETMGFMPFVQKVESRELTLSCPDGKKEISGEVRRNKITVTPSIDNDKPKYNISLDIGVRIVEAGCPFSIENSAQVTNLEKEIEQRYKEDIKKLLAKIQKEYKSDILGLEEEFKNRFPAEWKAQKDNWDVMFPEVSVSTNIKAEIKEASLLYKPTKNN